MLQEMHHLLGRVGRQHQAGMAGLDHAMVGEARQALHAGVGMRPNNRVAVPEDVLEPFNDLLERLDALDDVSEVYHNALLPADG